MPLRILTDRLKILRVTLFTVSYKAAAVDLCNLFPFSASNFTRYWNETFRSADTEINSISEAKLG